MTFALLQAAPGDYFDAVRMNGRISAETVARIRIAAAGNAQHTPSQGLSPVARYASWMSGLVQGDWGFSVVYQSPAAQILFPRLRNTLGLLLPAVLLSYGLAIPLAALTSWPPGDRLQSLLLRAYRTAYDAALASLLALPDLLLALLLLTFAVVTGRFPISGMGEEGNFGVSQLVSHAFLPVVCLLLSFAPVLAFHLRASFEEASTQPPINAAYALGVDRLRLVSRYMLPAALNPAFTLLGLSAGSLFGSALIIETVFSWPGLGRLLVASAAQRDFFVVADCCLLAAIAVIGANLLADILLYASDPRIRRRAF